MWPQNLFLTVIIIKCSLSVAFNKGEAKDENYWVEMSEPGSFSPIEYEEFIKEAIELGNTELLKLLVDRSDLLMQRGLREGQSRILEVLAKDPQNIDHLCKFIKKNSYNGSHKFLEKIVKNMAITSSLEAGLALYKIKKEFPLLAETAYHDWLDSQQNVILPISMLEEQLGVSIFMTEENLSSPLAQDFIHSMGGRITTSIIISPLELISQGYWRVGIIKQLAGSSNSDEARVIAQLLSGIVNYPLAFSQVLYIFGKRFTYLDVEWADGSLEGGIFQEVMVTLASISLPIPTCQNSFGSSLLISRKVVKKFENLHTKGKVELAQSLLSWLTRRPVDIFEEPLMASTKDAPIIFNEIITKFCREHNGLYPGVFINTRDDSQSLPGTIAFMFLCWVWFLLQIFLLNVVFAHEWSFRIYSETENGPRRIQFIRQKSVQLIFSSLASENLEKIPNLTLLLSRDEDDLTAQTVANFNFEIRGPAREIFLKWGQRIANTTDKISDLFVNLRVKKTDYLQYRVSIFPSLLIKTRQLGKLLMEWATEDSAKICGGTPMADYYQLPGWKIIVDPAIERLDGRRYMTIGRCQRFLDDFLDMYKPTDGDTLYLLPQNVHVQPGSPAGNFFVALTSKPKDPNYYREVRWMQTILKFKARNYRPFYGISVKFNTNGKLLFKVWYDYLVDHTIAIEMLSSIWDEIGIAEDKAQLVDISNWPMACVDSRYKVRLGQDLLIRGFGEEYHQGISRVGPEVFRFLDIHYLFRMNIEYGIWLESKLNPFHWSHSRASFKFNCLLRREILETWRPPVYHLIKWLLENPQPTCYGISFMILDEWVVRATESYYEVQVL